MRHRDFRLFMMGQLITQTGMWMQSVAQAWLVLQLSGSSLKLGIVSAAQTLPVLILSIVAGVVADRLPRRWVVMATQTTMMLCALALAFLTGTGVVQYWHVLVVALVLGMANTFDMPARQAFMVELVAPEDTVNAVAINSSVFNVCRLVGPALAGLLMGLWGPAVAFLLTGLSYVGVLSSLLRIQTREAGQPRVGVQRGLLSHVDEGVAYVRRVPRLGRALVLLGGLSIFCMNTNVLIPVFAQEVLRQEATGYGLLMSAMGAGALVGALTLVLRSHSGDPTGSRIAAAFVLSGALILLSFTRGFALALVVMALVGWGMVTFNAATNSTLQLHTPNFYRGRVMSLFSLMLVGVAPIGSLLTGTALEYLGASMTSLLAGGIGLLIIGLVRPWRDLRPDPGDGAASSDASAG
ncbi:MULTISPECIES: MFS transporter [Limnochorda]|uniref:MFS transporter n=1 Tax=Limnochorda TaxID=1676651 RepID=UPI0017C40CE1|nr:MFS transporter [Limnochorda pilosa]MBO2487393.1 MFS transporter [Bacillota bacterium]MBO2519817.1 MFS transporter [Bacillota bacterium]NMA70511.1 MFS transporter [Bacillota bacterium]